MHDLSHNYCSIKYSFIIKPKLSLHLASACPVVQIPHQSLSLVPMVCSPQPPVHVSLSVQYYQSTVVSCLGTEWKSIGFMYLYMSSYQYKHKCIHWYITVIQTVQEQQFRHNKWRHLSYLGTERAFVCIVHNVHCVLSIQTHCNNNGFWLRGFVIANCTKNS